MDRAIFIARLDDISRKLGDGLLQLKENNAAKNELTQFRAVDFESYLEEVCQEFDELIHELKTT
jgi:hypothetical protein